MWGAVVGQCFLASLGMSQKTIFDRQGNAVQLMDRCTATRRRLIKFHQQPFHVSEHGTGKARVGLLKRADERD